MKDNWTKLLVIKRAALFNLGVDISPGMNFSNLPLKHPLVVKITPISPSYCA
jgi:hypothetical protein